MPAATINGVAVASIASLNGVATASIANFNGIELAPPPAESDVIVADAGTSAANGTYTYTGVNGNGKRYYNKSGTDSISSAISWDAEKWVLYGSGGEQYYISNDDTTYPWEGTWEVGELGDSPAPTVSEG